MLRDGVIWVGKTADGRDINILPQMTNRHGMIAGATGTGKTVTLKVLAESFSNMGVPVFLADVKGDLAGMINPGVATEDMQRRIERFGLTGTGFEFQSYPTTFWDVYGEKGLQLRTTISEMGPLLLSRILDLNDIQSQILTIAFKLADENELLLIDTKDLKAMLNYMQENRQELAAEYGNISTSSVGAIMRSITALELDGGEIFFGEPALSIHDLFTVGEGGKGMINILASETLFNNKTLYSTFLLWMLSELFETLPEVGDLDKPKMVFFFDEAHLLFKGASKLLMEKIEQVVRLIRSKGVGVFFITQSPRDIPDTVLAQLGNKIQHGLHAYTPSDQKVVRAAAQSFRVNESFDTYETLLSLGTGEAVVSFLDEKGMPGICEKVAVLPPQSQMGSIDDVQRDRVVKGALLYGKYATAQDPDSAFEFLQRRGLEEAAAREREEAERLKAKEEEALEKEAAKQAEREEKERAREAAKEANAKKRAAKSVASSVTGTLGREVGKSLGGKFGKFGKTLGGNLGASLGRGILSTLFKQ